MGNNTYGTNMRLVLSSRAQNIAVAAAQFNAMTAILIEKHPIINCAGGVCHYKGDCGAHLAEFENITFQLGPEEWFHFNAASQFLQNNDRCDLQI
jgi:hypothetical protein